MIVTKHLLEQFVSLAGVEREVLVEGLSKSGLEVESFTPLRVADGVVVGRVTRKDSHPDAHKLSVCQVDVGNKVLQIVCGASNVQEDQFVATALEGAELHTPKGVLKIAPTELRGVKSEGMLCSSVELGLPKNGEGIMVLDHSIGELELGKPLNSYALFDNFVLEIGLTPNRGDCLSVLGVARDLAVVLGRSIHLKAYRDENVVLGIGRVLQVINDGEFESSLLYKVAQITAIQTPLEICLSLLLCGLECKNPLHDFLAYAMHNCGVILKSYPFSYFQPRQEGAKAEITLKKDENGLDCVYAKEKVSVVGVSGVSGEKSQGMIVLEASYSDPMVISEALYAYPKLERDSAITYKSTRGSNPDLAFGMQYLCEKLIRFSQIEVYASSHSYIPDERIRNIKTTFNEVLEILGLKIDKEEVAIILKKLGFRVEASFDESFFMAIPPLYRHDIQTSQDLAEEVLRIYGIDHLTSTPLKMLEQTPRRNQKYFEYKTKRDLIRKANAQGFCETLHYVFYDRAKMLELGLVCIDESLEIVNPITNELNTLRTSLVPAMVDSVQRNQNFGFKKIALCELGICYDTQRQEQQKLAFVVNEYKEIEKFPHSKGKKRDFYEFARSISAILGEFELEKLEDLPFGTSWEILHPYQSASIIKDGEKIGYIGKFNPQYMEGFVCEVALIPLLKESKNTQQGFSKYQSSLRDLTVMIDREITFERVKSAILQEGIPYISALYPLDLYENQDFGNEVALSLRFVLQAEDKTLQDQDLAESVQRVLNLLQERFGASLRQ